MGSGGVKPKDFVCVFRSIRLNVQANIMLLLGEAGGGVPVSINLQVNAQLLHQRYAELVKRIEEELEPPAAMDLHSGEENLQK
jgi:hypothetical protein